MKKSILFAVALFTLTACQVAPPDSPPAPEVSNFEECIAAGNPAMESYPRQCRHEGQNFVEELNESEDACLTADGTWLPDTRECEWISKEKCEELGGTYNECASACRNDPTAEICTMQCVLVCQF